MHALEIMQTPVDITFRGMPKSLAAEASVTRWVDRLARAFGRILRCTVVIEVPHRSQRQGQTFHVRVEIAIPDHVVEVSRDPGIDHTHEDLYMAISDAFRAARRQLQDRTQIQRGEIKLHA